MNPYLLIAQVACQFAWGIYCFFHSPHNVMLSLLNVALIVITVASHLAGDDELLFQRAYLATWVIPAAIIAFSQLAGLVEIENITLAKAGVPPLAPPIDGSSTAYAAAFHHYLISQLIAPTFRVNNWLLRLF